MKKIVVLTGSPRKDGNSNRMAESFIATAENKGYEVTRFDTAQMNVGGCMACSQCYTKDGQACVYNNDDFNKIAPALLAADAIVITTPLYWFAFPAKLKAVIDKWTTFAATGKSFAGKTAALIACCGIDNTEVFEGLLYSYRVSMDLMKCRSVGEVLIPGVYPVGDIKKTDGEKQAAALLDQLF